MGVVRLSRQMLVGFGEQSLVTFHLVVRRLCMSGKYGSMIG